MAILTTAQKTALKSFVQADPVLSLLPPNSDSYFTIAAALNVEAAGPWVVWRVTTAIDSIRNAIDWAKMTPAQAPDSTALQTNKYLLAQAKQINLNNLLTGSSTVVPSGQANLRAAFQDCLTQLPTKADGTNQPAGWTAVQTVMQRNATIAEKILSTGTGTAVSPADLGWEGKLSTSDVQAFMES